MSEVRFINRVKELNALKEWCSTFRYTPLYIYGPEGCGKTRLLKEFIFKFDELFGENAVAIYIDALEDRDIKRALISSSRISKIVNVFKISIEAISDLIKTGVPIGQALSRSISLILDKIVEKFPKRSLKDKYILVAIDDVTRAIGLNKIEWYIKWLFELMNKLNEDYRPKAVNFIITTSEGVSRRLIARHRHAEILLLWNLDRESFRELFYELKPPRNKEFESIWQLFGGNPGKLIELSYRYGWNIDRMLRAYEARIREIVKRIIREGLVKELERFIENIVVAEKIMGKKMSRLEDILEKENFILYKHWVSLTYEVFDKVYPELGIGKDYAWQVPMYKELMKKELIKLTS